MSPRWKAPSVLAYARHGIPYTRPDGSLGDRFQEYIAALGPTAKYDRHEGAMHVPVEDVPSALARLRGALFGVTEHGTLAPVLTATRAIDEARSDQAARRADKLYPYQKAGVAWLAGRRAALLADEMGLGKTAQLLIAMPAAAPALVVCPAVAVGTWRREIRLWRPDRIAVPLARKGFKLLPAPYVGIVSYDSLPLDVAPPRDLTLIPDEAHAVKSPKSKRTRAFRTLAARTLTLGGRVWLATGTPLENKPQELWHLLTAADLAIRAFTSWDNFVQLFGGMPAGPKGRWEKRASLVCEVSGKDCATDPDICINLEARLAHPCASCAAFMSGKSERAFVEDPNGTAGKHGFAWTLAAPEARACLDRVMLRRKRADVLPDLPTKRYATLACDLDAASLAACDAALAGGFLREGESAEELHARLSKPAEFTTVSSLLEKLSTAKIPSLLEHVQAFEESEEPLVVFSPHRRPVEALAGREGWLSILGDDTPEARAKKVDAFQGGRYRGIAGTTAMGTSVTLTRASHVLFCGRPWNPEKGRQMEDRVCRIGQDRGVMVYDLVSEHPLDARLSEVLRGKDALIGSLL